MRSFSKFAVCSIALVSIFLIASSVAFAGKTITVVSWGGAYTKSQIEALHKPFTAKTGIKINSEDYTGGLAQIRAMVQAGNVTWDLVDVDPFDLYAGCDEGLFEIFDLTSIPPGADGTPAIKDFIPGALHECGVGSLVWTYIIAYNNTKFPG